MAQTNALGSECDATAPRARSKGYVDLDLAAVWQELQPLGSCAAPEPDAYDRVIVLLRPWVSAVLGMRYQIGDSDVLAEMFHYFWIRIHRYRSSIARLQSLNHLKGYLYRTALSAAGDFFKSNRTLGVQVEVLEHGDGGDQVLEIHAGVKLREDLSLLKRAMDALSDDERELVSLSFHFSIPEIAATNRWPVEETRKRVRSARGQLANNLRNGLP